MRIGRLYVGLCPLFRKDAWVLNWDEYNCFCKILDIGPLNLTWLSCECMAGEYATKARLYRVRRYLKARKKRATSSLSRSNSL